MLRLFLYPLLFLAMQCKVPPVQNKTVLANSHIPDFWGKYGWNASPENLDKGLEDTEKGEWFYTMSTGEVRSENMKTSSKSFRTFLCGRDALQTGKAFFHKRIAETEKIDESLAVEKMRQTDVFVYGVRECRPLEDSPQFVNCDCNIYVYIPGGRKIFK